MRDAQLQMIEDLMAKEIEVEEASTCAKLFETVLSGCKTQMEYHKLTNTVPHIPFLHEGNGKLIEAEIEKKGIERR